MAKYWHAYGGVVPPDHGDLSGGWAQVVVGPFHQKTHLAQWDLSSAGHEDLELPYLCTWDHEPTTEERNSLEPHDGFDPFRVEVTYRA